MSHRPSFCWRLGSKDTGAQHGEGTGGCGELLGVEASGHREVTMSQCRSWQKKDRAGSRQASLGRAEGIWRRAFGCPGVGMYVYGRESRRAGCRRLTPSVISWRPGPRRGEGPNWICPGSDQERASGTQSPQALRPPREIWVKCVRSRLLIQDRSPPSPFWPMWAKKMGA